MCSVMVLLLEPTPLTLQCVLSIRVILNSIQTTLTMIVRYDPCTAPPSALERGLSPKAVDYYADPDRRPYGFRLKNGKDLTRSSYIAWQKIIWMPLIGMECPLFPITRSISRAILTCIVVIGNTVQTSQNLNGSASRNTSFAQVNSDHWRPSEIIADAVNILSSNFCDGTIDSGIVNPNNKGVCPNADQRSSYQNSHMWATNPATTAKWECEHSAYPRPDTGGYPSSCTVPIKVCRNGEVKLEWRERIQYL